MPHQVKVSSFTQPIRDKFAPQSTLHCWEYDILGIGTERNAFKGGGSKETSAVATLKLPTSSSCTTRGFVVVFHSEYEDGHVFIGTAQCIEIYAR